MDEDRTEVVDYLARQNFSDREIDSLVYRLYDLTEDEIRIVEEA